MMNNSRYMVKNTKSTADICLSCCILY
jgi:hypothetical protein